MKDLIAINRLVDEFAVLADNKDAKKQGDLFDENGVLEFQMGLEGEIKKIEGREELVKAFDATISPCIALYHLNGQHIVDLDNNKATGIAYCQATLVNQVNGKNIVSVNSVRYKDEYIKVDGEWFIKKRRTTFLITDRHELKEGE